MNQSHVPFRQFQAQALHDYAGAESALEHMPNPPAIWGFCVIAGAGALWFISVALIWTFLELSDELASAIPFVLLPVWIAPAILLARRWGQQRRDYWQMAVRAGHLSTLNALLKVLADDVHPQSGVKGHLDTATANSIQHLVRSKRSRSGKHVSEYFRHNWADLRLTLMDGSDLRLKLECKFKYKSSELERSLRLQRGSLHYNTLLYTPTQGAQQTQHTAMVSPQNYLTWVARSPSHFRFRIEQPGWLDEEQLSLHAAMQTLKMCRYSYFYLQPQKAGATSSTVAASTAKKSVQGPLRSHPKTRTQPQTDDSPQPPTASPQPQASSPFTHWVKASALRPRIQETTSQGITLSCQGELVFMAECIVKGGAYLTLQLKVDYLTGVTPAQLLRANPTLAHARFAQDAKGTVFLCKSLLVATLDQPEFDATLQELLALSHQLRMAPDMPQRLKRADAIPAAELKALFAPILTDLDAEAQLLERYYKVRLTLASGRRQKIYVRTDRQDGGKRPVLALMTFAQPYTGQPLAAHLRANLEPGYGAVGLAMHGGKEYVVVSETQLWETADAQELETMLARLAAMGDRLEREVSTADVL